MSRSKRERKREKPVASGSSLKEEFESVELAIKSLGNCWREISDFEVQKKFISKKQKAYDAFNSLKKKTFLVLGI